MVRLDFVLLALLPWASVAGTSIHDRHNYARLGQCRMFPRFCGTFWAVGRTRASDRYPKPCSCRDSSGKATRSASPCCFWARVARHMKEGRQGMLATSTKASFLILAIALHTPCCCCFVTIGLFLCQNFSRASPDLAWKTHQLNCSSRLVHCHNKQ